MKTSKLLDAEFKTLVIRVLSELSIKKGMEIIKKNQSDIKDTLK